MKYCWVWPETNSKKNHKNRNKWINSIPATGGNIFVINSWEQAVTDSPCWSHGESWNYLSQCGTLRRTRWAQFAFLRQAEPFHEHRYYLTYESRKSTGRKYKLRVKFYRQFHLIRVLFLRIFHSYDIVQHRLKPCRARVTPWQSADCENTEQKASMHGLELTAIALWRTPNKSLTR